MNSFGPENAYFGKAENGQPGGAQPESGSSTGRAPGQSYYCPHCGHPSPGLNLYCGQCGTFIQDPYPAASTSRVSVRHRRKRPGVNWLPWTFAVLVAAALLGAAALFGGAAGVAGKDKASGATAQFPTLTLPPPAEAAAQPAPTQAPPVAAVLATEAPRDTPTAWVVTAKPLPSPTPSRTPQECPGAPEQRLEVGEDAKVCTRTENVYLRSGPGRDHPVVERVSPGTVVLVTGGPECSDEWSYWEVELPGGETGWMSEGGDEEDPYFLCPN